VDSLFICVSNRFWNGLRADQQTTLRAAAQAAANYNNVKRIADERELIAFFKSHGMTVNTPDLAAFRKGVQSAYLNSDYAKVWPPGMLERINATK
jgi:TRAP-type C4-dicarboxylate transport system substrate-binding protein